MGNNKLMPLSFQVHMPSPKLTIQLDVYPLLLNDPRQKTHSFRTLNRKDVLPDQKMAYIIAVNGMQMMHLLLKQFFQCD